MFVALILTLCLSSEAVDTIDPASYEDPEKVYAAISNLEIHQDEITKSEKFQTIQLMSQLVSRMKILLVTHYREGRFQPDRASFLLSEAYFKLGEYLKSVGELAAAERCDAMAEPFYRETSIEANRVMVKAIIISMSDKERAMEVAQDYMSQRPFLQRSTARGKYEMTLLRFLAKLQIQTGREAEGLENLETYFEYAADHPALITRSDLTVHEHYIGLHQKHKGRLPVARRNQIEKAIKEYGRGRAEAAHEMRDRMREARTQQDIEDKAISAENFIALYGE